MLTKEESFDSRTPTMGDIQERAPQRVGQKLAGRLNSAGSSIVGRLRAVAETVEGRTVFTTSFGIEDQLIAHFLFTEKLPFEVVTLDTGRLFPSTYKLWQQTEERYGVRIRSYHPEAGEIAAVVADSGINGFHHSKEARLACCNARKIAPLGRALAGAAAWLTGLRTGQSDQRASVELAAWDAERSLIKIAPLFDRSRAEVAADCEALGVPVNALHGKGFLSIGCEPCTRALKPGEPERAGRWWWEGDDAKECGLHVGTDGRLQRSKAA